MTRVMVARLKAGLSSYLRKVKRGGEVVVYDRETPVARIIPYTDASRQGGLIIRAARQGVRLQDVRLPPPLPMGHNIVQMLIDERQQERDRLP